MTNPRRFLSIQKRWWLQEAAAAISDGTTVATTGGAAVDEEHHRPAAVGRALLQAAAVFQFAGCCPDRPPRTSSGGQDTRGALAGTSGGDAGASFRRFRCAASTPRALYEHSTRVLYLPHAAESTAVPDGWIRPPAAGASSLPAIVVRS